MIGGCDSPSIDVLKNTFVPRTLGVVENNLEVVEFAVLVNVDLNIIANNGDEWYFAVWSNDSQFFPSLWKPTEDRSKMSIHYKSELY